MKFSILPIAVALAVAAFPPLHGKPQPPAPDSIVLKDGTVFKGLIVQNTRDAVTIQKSHHELTIPKSEILRIYDEADLGTYFTDPARRGSLPPWRVIVNDLRTIDDVKSLEQIPATCIDNGEFKNVPYLSFRVNRDVELNIYGNPDDPAAIELGIYGARSGDDELRKRLRAFLAGYLSSREEIAALYRLPLDEGAISAGGLVLETTPKDAPDAYGAWWLSIYHASALDSARLSKEEYARLTRPVDEVVDREGNVLPGSWTEDEARRSRRIDGDDGTEDRFFLRGFYRDENGQFRLLTITRPAP